MKLEKSFEKIIGYYCVLLIVIVWLFLFAKSWEWVTDFNVSIVCQFECTECRWCSGNVNIMLIVCWGLKWILLIVTCPWTIWKTSTLRWGLIVCFKWQSTNGWLNNSVKPQGTYCIYEADLLYIMILPFVWFPQVQYCGTDV